ncbi:MAG: hypothetical protein KIT34_02455 [Cyanobacteria bacterium TGS_CYA1]|nr:hypothetical protein [Cyanobacteria bacterium TGS_CYA1]
MTKFKIIATVFGAFVLNTSTLCGLSQTTGSSWYPQSISLPANHKYPCALNPLPRDLKGIPQNEKLYIDHSFSLLLKMLQAKIVMFDTVSWDNQQYQSAYTTYYFSTVSARQKFLQLATPKGLEGFKNDVINGLDKQIVFFQKSAKMRADGKSAQDILAIPEGKAASSLYMSAWQKIETRYPGLSAPVKDSMYHHLCALDIF